VPIAKTLAFPVLIDTVIFVLEQAPIGTLVALRFSHEADLLTVNVMGVEPLFTV
jgi:hypothetical protein